MKGKTNSACGGTGDGDVVFAENQLGKDPVEAGEKVLVRRFSSVPDATHYAYQTNSFSCLPIIKNRFVVITNANSKGELAVIEDDSSLKTITRLTYYNDYSPNNYEQTFMIDNWILYCIRDTSVSAINTDTLVNVKHYNLTYSGYDKYFYSTYSMKECSIWKFNTQNGAMERYFTIHQPLEYNYRYIPLLFYNDALLTYYSYNGYRDIYLYKINRETQEKEEAVHIENATSIFDTNKEICSIFLYPSCCCIKKVGGGYHVVKIGEDGKTLFYTPLNCLGFEDDLATIRYNTTLKTFTIIKTEDSKTYLYILKFDPEKLITLEFVEKIDLTDALEKFRQSIGAEKISVYKYTSVTDDMNRLQALLYDGKRFYYAVIINLQNTLTGWQAVVDSTYNYNKCSLTAISTGNTDADKKVELKTVLPNKVSVTLNTNDIDATIKVEGNAL